MTMTFSWEPSISVIRDQAGTCAASVENGQENGIRILGLAHASTVGLSSVLKLYIVF